MEKKANLFRLIETWFWNEKIIVMKLIFNLNKGFDRLLNNISKHMFLFINLF